MKPAICTSFDYSIPFDRVIPLAREAGFEVVMLGASAEHSGYATATGRAAARRLLEANGITIDSVHAPFPEGDRLFSGNEEERQESLRQCRVAAEAAADLDGRIVVIHLIQPYGIPPGALRDHMVQQGRRSVEALAAHTGKLGVRLALENGQKRDYDQVLEDLLTEFDTPHVGFCYDSGHENVQGTCFRLLETYGARLFTVHLHDNRGSDTHDLPFDGAIDWGRFRAVFHRLGYAGHLTLEVHLDRSRFAAPEAFLRQAWERANRLLERPVSGLAAQQTG